MWTSSQHLRYQVIVAHFIDDNWILQNFLLSFKLLEHPHWGSNMATLFLDVLQKFNTHERISSLTLDSASNNNKMVECIGRRTRLSFQKKYSYLM